MLPLRLVAPVAWTALIAWLSSPGWSAQDTGSLLLPLLRALAPWARPEQLDAAHWLIRKGAHFSEYAVLAVLWRWALTARVVRSWNVALLLCAVTATLDEVHQATTATRTGSPWDALLDTAGAGAGLIAVINGLAAIDRLIAALLWIGAIGGAAVLAINWLAGAPSGWLWVSVPASWLLLLVWRRARS